MDIVNIYKQYGVFIASESDRHYRDGWVNTPCPYCTGNPGNHLGYNLQDNYFKCWRCGFHPTIKVLMRLLNLSYEEVKEIVYRNKGIKGFYHNKHIRITKKAFKTPSNLQPISEVPYCQKYLEKRGFDPLFLENRYSIKATGPISELDKIDYRFRIFIPIFYDNEEVSWQTRDCTGKHNIKYLSCPKNRELVHHKDTLYQNPLTDIIVLCEGVFDVWKVEMAGYPATCTFGIGYKVSQLLLLAINYQKIIIFFDSEPQAQEQALDMQKRLLLGGREAINICPPKFIDPGAMKPKEIRNLIK